MADQQITCSDCGATFTFTEDEQAFYASKQLRPPLRCKPCRAARKAQKFDRTFYDATCAQCGSACQVPFKPRPEAEGGRPVYCKTCFLAKRGGDRAAA
jgi:CxxC-x17-CxxC domain-containing protein